MTICYGELPDIKSQTHKIGSQSLIQGTIIRTGNLDINTTLTLPRHKAVLLFELLPSLYVLSPPHPKKSKWHLPHSSAIPLQKCNDHIFILTFPHHTIHCFCTSWYGRPWTILQGITLSHWNKQSHRKCLSLNCSSQPDNPGYESILWFLLFPTTLPSSSFSSMRCTFSLRWPHILLKHTISSS